MNVGKLSLFLAFVAIFGCISLISAKDTVKKPEVDADPTECALCEFVMKELEGLVSENATRQEIEAAFEKVCSFLPTTVQADCKRLVNDYADEIIDLLLEAASPEEICKLITLCPSSNDKSTIPGPQCAICKMVVGKLADMLATNATEAEIQAALVKVCNLLPSTYAHECDDFVNEYTPMIIHLILQDVAPEAICGLIQLCSAPKALPVLTKVDAGEQCALCELIMKEVESLLAENSTESEIEAALKKVCSYLPSTLTKECNDFVTDYLPTLINLLVNKESPKVICTLLKFCTATKPALQKPLLLTKAKPVLSANVDVKENCALCEMVMREIDSTLTQNSTEEEITKVIENICTVLPGTLTAQCDSFLDVYGPTLITLLVQQLDPKKICTAIGLCTKDSKVYQTNPSDGPVIANSELCVLCEFVMKELQGFITENSTEEEIKAAFDDVCNILPSTLKTPCLLFVNNYADVIIELLAKGIDPTQICRAIGFCDKMAATSDDECDLCQMLIKFADDFVRNNSTEEEIVKGLLDLCGILPGDLKDQCTDIITQYGTVIPALIAEFLSPLKVCEVLGLCSQAKQGDAFCSKGPIVWCASLENAKLCNAVTHCERHVWN